MVHILGVQLKDSHLAKYALTKFYGVGNKTAARLCARFQIHDKARVSQLSPYQVTSLASFLSSPTTAPPIPRYPLASTKFTPPPPNTPTAELQAQFATEQGNLLLAEKKIVEGRNKPYNDPLKTLKIESELRNQIREDIAHQRMIGSYVGRRHAMHLPVRGQNTQTNAKTAKRLNRLDRH